MQNCILGRSDGCSGDTWDRQNFEMAFDVNHIECPEAAQIMVKELPAFPKQEQGKEQQANPTQIHVHGSVRLWDIRLKPWDRTASSDRKIALG